MPKNNTISELGNNLSILLKNVPAGLSKAGLQSIINGLTAPLQVMIMGEFSVGKSTFINALLEKEVAIASPIPTTAVITKFVYGSKDRTIVHFLDGGQQEYNPQDFNRLTVENNGKYKEMHDSIEYVERQLPNELLKIYNFIDSPGRNAIVEKHEEVTRNFVENADAMLWLFSVDQMGGKSEKEVLQSFSKRLKPIAIVNKVDMVDDDDELDELLDELKLNFKDDIADVVPISAEYALQGVLERKNDLLEFSNFKEVFAKLQQHIGARQVYLKAKKAMQDLVPALQEYEKAATQAVKTAFLAEKNNYAFYASRLKAAVKLHDSMGEAIRNIAALLADAIGKRELPESNADYREIRTIGKAWDEACQNGVGKVLYAALHGDAAAQYEYAKNQREKAAAEYWYKEAGSGGYLPAQQVLYKNYQPAGYWYERAAQNGDKYAILQIALSYYCGRNDVEKNLQKAAYWLEKAVQYEQDGVNEAKKCLAYLYADGSVVKQDYKKAYVLASAAAKAGNVYAMSLAAWLMYNGHGVPENKIEAFGLWRKGGFNDEIEKYFVNDNFALHKKIAEELCGKNAGSNKADEKYSSAYFWYKLDFEHNDDTDSAFACGDICEQAKNWQEAFQWYDICAKRNNLEAIERAGDICYFKFEKLRQSMKYYAKGMLKGNKYCGKMLWKYVAKRGLQTFAIYAVLSVMVHMIGIHAYSIRNEKIDKDNQNFLEAKSSLDRIQRDYQNGSYRVNSEYDSTVSEFEKKINILKNISENFSKAEQKFHEEHDYYRDIDKYFLFSDYVMENHFTLIDSKVTDKYNHDYDDTLHSMQQDEERLARLAREYRAQPQNIPSQAQSSDMNLSQSDIRNAAQVFRDYHAAISNNNFDRAYSMLTLQRQNSFGSSSKLAEGYRTTLESTVIDIKCKDIDGNEVVFEYELRAKDKTKGSRILVQYFQGEVHMFKLKGEWHIGYAESKKTSEKYE